MKKNLPYFLVIAALIFLITGVLFSGEKERKEPASAPQTVSTAASKAKKLITSAAIPSKVQTAGRGAVLAPSGEERILFGFEKKAPLWEVPDWCYEKDDYVAEGLDFSHDFAKEGKGSLKMLASFPGSKWTAAYIEGQEFFDWTPYRNLFADVYLPADAPFGLQAKIILTVGEDWNWTEMSRMVKLVPGEWTTISASLIPGSTDWRRTDVTDAFRADVRKIGIRVESNIQPIYSGPIYIDNVRLN